MRNVHFVTNIGNEMKFDENGDPPAIYEVLNWQLVGENELQLKAVGVFDSNAPPGQELRLEHDAIMWKRRTHEVRTKF